MTAWVRADPLRAVLVAVALVTAAAGGLCIVAPGFVLRGLEAEVGSTPRLLIATVGMFLIVVGGLLAQTLLSAQTAAAVLVWSATEKVGVVVVVGVGVGSGILGPTALAVGSVDLLTAVLLLVRWRHISATQPVDQPQLAHRVRQNG